VAAVKYAANTFVMFINNPLSVHAVTARGSSRISRRLINFTVGGWVQGGGVQGAGCRGEREKGGEWHFWD